MRRRVERYKRRRQNNDDRQFEIDLQQTQLINNVRNLPVEARVVILRELIYKMSVEEILKIYRISKSKYILDWCLQAFELRVRERLGSERVSILLERLAPFINDRLFWRHLCLAVWTNPWLYEIQDIDFNELRNMGQDSHFDVILGTPDDDKRYTIWNVGGGQLLLIVDGDANYDLRTDPSLNLLINIFGPWVVDTLDTDNDDPAYVMVDVNAWNAYHHMILVFRLIHEAGVTVPAVVNGEYVKVRSQCIQCKNVATLKDTETQHVYCSEKCWSESVNK